MAAGGGAGAGAISLSARGLSVEGALISSLVTGVKMTMRWDATRCVRVLGSDRRAH